MQLITSSKQIPRQRKKLKKAGNRSFRREFIPVFGLGYRWYYLNMGGQTVVKITQTYLPFLMIESVQNFINPDHE